MLLAKEFTQLYFAISLLNAYLGILWHLHPANPLGVKPLQLINVLKLGFLEPNITMLTTKYR